MTSYQDSTERVIYVPPIGIVVKSPFKGNRIRTARFTIFDFLPRQLYIQFRKPINFYFLVIAILQMLPGLSSTGSSTVFPLALFTLVAIIREGYFDYRRHLQDNIQNDQKVYKLEAPNQWVRVSWKDVQVGDKLKILKNEYVPADVMLVSSNDEFGQCYLETASLDGETNAKHKISVFHNINTLEAITGFTCSIHAPIPNSDLYSFDGKVQIGESNTIITNDNILLRGTKVVRTEFVFGIVIYAGEDSKIRKNASLNVTNKIPRMELQTEKFLGVSGVILILTTIAHFVAFYINEEVYFSALPHIYGTAQDPGKVFFTFLILYNSLIPLSLYVTLETVKLIQAYLISNDLEMYKGNIGCVPRTSSLNEVSTFDSGIGTDLLLVQ